MLAQVTPWGNSQGVRIPKKLLKLTGIDINDSVEITASSNMLIIKPAAKKPLSWYLDSYSDELDRYDWGSLDEPKGRELI